ncbi:MAG: hypothetical protein U0572_08275 [Phycisphaerales bacterium]
MRRFGPAVVAVCFVVSAPRGLADEVSHFRASSFSLSAQHEACAGNFSGDDAMVVAWTSKRQQGGLAGIYAQRFDRDGVAVGGETQVNLWTGSQKAAPTVAGRPDGALIAWASFAQDGDAGAIIARVFDRSFNGGDEFLVNESTRGDQHDPVASTDGSGSTLVAWVSEDGADVASIRGRVLGNDSTWGPEFAIARGTNGLRAPSVAPRRDGGWVVAWTEDESVRTIAIDGRGAPTRSAEVIAADAYEAALAGGDGGFVVAYASPDHASHAVVAQRLDGDGCPIGHSHAVGHGNGAEVVASPDGSSVVLWNETLTDADGAPVQRIAARRLDARGAPNDTERVLTASLPHEQSLRAATGVRRGVALGDRIAFAWHGDAGAGDKSAANVTMIAPDAITLSGRSQGVDAKVASAALAPEGGASPHVPPTFDPRGAEKAERTFTVSDLGLGFDAIVDTGWTPPDVSLAVGPSHLVSIVNGRISFFTKAGAQTFTQQIEGGSGFWGSVGATNFVFDPEVIFDPLSGRFFAMASEGNAPGAKSYALIAVSDDGDPNGTWFKYRIETTALAGAIFDSPNIGVDSSAVYVTGDGSNGNYQIYIWDKASMLVGAPPAISKSLNYVTSVQSAGLAPVWYPDQSTVVLVEHKEAASNTQVRLIAIKNPLTAPATQTLDLTVAAYGPPEDPPQKGTSLKINTFDARFWSADYRNGSLWATHHVGLSRVLVRWYEIKLNGWPTSGNLPVVAQQGTIDPGTPMRTYYTAIGVDANNNAVLTFARSSPNDYISMCVAQRKATDAPGTFGPVQVVKTNTGAYTEADRWGDYAAARADNSVQGGFWASHEYAVNANTWRAWAQQVTFPPPSPDLNGDGAVDARDLAVLLGAWGTAGPVGDLNIDGVVNDADMAILLEAWSG